MRKALIVGIDYYSRLSKLSGCVNDAFAVGAALEQHANGDLDFADPKTLTAPDASRPVREAELRQAVKRLFAGDAEIALFYFAGHGYAGDTGGYLCTSDSQAADDGLTLSEVMALANLSTASNKVIVLDSCHSGAIGNIAPLANVATIASGLTILTASTADQDAYERPDGSAGLFTSLFVDALNGSAANLVGDVTPGSVYAHIDQSLGPWAQRPVFKTNVERFVSLRKAEASISLEELRNLPLYFRAPDQEFRLDPSFEPERSSEECENPSIPPPDLANTAIFRTLQNYVRVNLVRPVDAPHMWHAAMQSKSCALTVLGRHYWNLAKKRLI